MATIFGAILSLILILLVWDAVARLLRKTKKSASKLTVGDTEDKEIFVVAPYLQLGNNPRRSDKDSLELVWFTSDRGHLWAVEARQLGSDRWIGLDIPSEHRINIHGMKPKRRYQVTLSRLEPGVRYEYRILRGGEPVFSGRALAPKSASQPFRFVAAGDLATGRSGSKNVAYQISQAKPDLLVIPGDVAYKHGRISEYRERFFPAFNSDAPHFLQGGPIIRSTLSVASFGNHDAGTPDPPADVRDLEMYPDLLGYFIFWSQPLNGPAGKVDGPNTPDLVGSGTRKRAFLSAAGERFPRMANFSFDYGNAHWLVLDANYYMDWTNPELRAWVEQDLAGSKANWKFVVYHQGGFTSDVKHFDEQRMRLLADIFERTGVNVVFNGHNHAYERNYPLRFRIKPQPDGKLISPEGRVDGDLTLDKKFDGKSNTRPDGVLYIVTGAGGGKLNLEPERRAQRDKLPPFTNVIFDDVHSFTVCDVDGDKLTFRQISAYGVELDSFTVTK